MDEAESWGQSRGIPCHHYHASSAADAHIHTLTRGHVKPGFFMHGQCSPSLWVQSMPAKNANGTLA